MADGSIVIDTEIDADGIEAGANDVKASLDKIITILQGMAKTVDEIFSQYSSGAITAAKNTCNLRKEIEETAKAQEKWKPQDMSQLNITRPEPVKYDDDEGDITDEEVDAIYEKVRARKVSSNATVEETKNENKLRKAIDETTKQLEELENQGFWVGDEVYDKKASQLKQLKEDAKSLEKEAYTDFVGNLFDPSTIEGRLENAKKALSDFKKSGVSIEDPEMQAAIKQVAELEETYKKAYTEAAKTDAQRKKEADVLIAQEQRKAEIQAAIAAREEEQQRKANLRVAEMNRRLEESRAKEVQAAVEAKKLQEIARNAEVSNQSIVNLNKELESLIQRQAVLKRAGVGLGSKEFDKNSSRISEINSKLKEYQKSLSASGKEVQNTNKKLSIAQSLADKIKSAFFGISKLSSGPVKNVGNVMSLSLGSALKTLFKYALGIRTLFILVNKLRSAMIEGFKNLAQYSDGTNNSISMLMSALTQLKNALATAFAPILTVIAPILTTFINLLSRAATYVGMFFAALTGQKTFAKAVAVQEDYAKSLQNTSSSTKQAAKDTKKASKETEGYLSTLDEVERYSSNKNSDTGSDVGTSPASGGYQAPSPSEMFQTVPVESAFTDLAKKLKKVFSEIFTPFKQAWAKEGQKTIKAAKHAFSSLGTLAKSVGKSLLEVWTNGTGTKILETMLQIAQNILTTIGNIASRFAEAWNQNSVGTTIIQNIANALQVVLSFVNRIAEDTARWAANLDFYPLLESISNLTANWAPVLEAIGNTLEWIYKNIVLPMLTWLIETGIPTVINLSANLGKFLADHQSIVEAFGAALIGAFAAVKIAKLALSIIKSVSGIITMAKGAVALMTGSGGVLGGISAIATALGPAGIFVVAVTAAIAIGVLLYKNWDKIKEAATKLKDWVIEKTRWMSDGVTRTLGNLKEKISGVWKYVSEKTTTTFKNMWNTVTTKVAAIRNAIVNKFSNARDTVVDTFTKIRDTVASVFNKVISTVNGAIGTINGAISTVESAFSFGPWKVPTPTGSKTIGFKASFPRVPTVPYLAKGAVIPPRSEFLAVLGDQKNGRNLEAPEGLFGKLLTMRLRRTRAVAAIPD